MDNETYNFIRKVGMQAMEALETGYKPHEKPYERLFQLGMPL